MIQIDYADGLPTVIRPTSSAISLADRWDHILARCGVNRGGHRVEAGLYALGEPTPDSPVFVTANYTLSFDALRSALAGRDGYILVLDTAGINVWCAAGKGTFGTDELVGRIKATGLGAVVSHRTLILPQLGAPGVAAHEVQQRSGFRVKYGPVRAADLPEYLATGATPQMRRVEFGLADRAVLIPVEIRLPLLILIVALALMQAGVLSTRWSDLGWLAAIFAGTVLFPLVLPWLPTRELASKGLILGVLVTLPFAWQAVVAQPDVAWWQQVGGALTYPLLYAPITAYLALGFTGSTTFTSRTGVRHEIFTYIPAMAWMLGLGVVMVVVLRLV